MAGQGVANIVNSGPASGTFDTNGNYTGASNSAVNFTVSQIDDQLSRSSVDISAGTVGFADPQYSFDYPASGGGRAGGSVTFAGALIFSTSSVAAGSGIGLVFDASQAAGPLSLGSSTSNLTLSTTASGAFSVANAGPLTVMGNGVTSQATLTSQGGMVTVDAGAGVLALGGSVTSGGGAVVLNGQTIAIGTATPARAGAVNAGGGTASLTAGSGGISETVGSTLTAGALTATATGGGAVTLTKAGPNGNLVSTANLSGASVTFVDGEALNLLGATASAGDVMVQTTTGLLTVSGVVSSTPAAGQTAAVKLAGDSLALGAAVSAAGGTVTLNATGSAPGAGSISQTGGTITAGTLTVAATGAVDLGYQASPVANKVGSASLSGSGVSFTDAQALTLTSASAANGGSVTVASTGALTLATNAIGAAGQVMLTGTSITGGDLILPGGASLTANGPASPDASAASVSLGALTLSGPQAATLVSNYGNVSLTSASSQTAGQGTLLVSAAGGTFTTAGSIGGAGALAGLGIDAVSATISNPVSVGTIAADLTGAGSGLTLDDGAATLTVGSLGGVSYTGLTTNGGASSLTAGGVTVGSAVNVGGGSLALTATGAAGLSLNAATATGAGGTLTLTSSGGGAVSQTAGVQATNLYALASGGGGVTLTNTANTVSTLTGGGAGGAFALTSGIGLAVTGGVTASTVTLQAATLALGAIAVNGANGVALTAATGAVTQAATGSVVGTQLSATAATGLQLTGSGNSITAVSNLSLTGAATGAAQSISFTDGTALTVGVAGVSGSVSAPAGDVTLTASSLSVAAPVSAGYSAMAPAGSTGQVALTATGSGGIALSNTVGGAVSVTLNAGAGAVSQTAAGAITTPSLSVLGGSVDLSAAANFVTRLASASTSGPLAFSNGGDLLVTASTTSVQGALTLTSGDDLTLDGGALSAQGSVTLTAAGALSTAGETLNGTGATYSVTAGGFPGQAANGALSPIFNAAGQNFTIHQTGPGDLDVTPIGGSTPGGALSVTVDNGALTAGTVSLKAGSITVQAKTSVTTGAVTSTAGDISLTGQVGGVTLGGLVQSAGKLTVQSNGSLSASQITAAGTVSLTSQAGGVTLNGAVLASGQAVTLAGAGGSGAVLQQTSGTPGGAVTGITAASLSVTAAGSAVLNDPTNTVGALSLLNASGGASYVGGTSGVLQVGAASPGTGTLSITNAGSAAGGVRLTGAISAAGQLVTLGSSQGSVTDTSAASLTAGTLNVSAATGVVLTSGLENAPTFALANAGPGGVSFADVFSGPVSGRATTGSGNVSLTTTGSLALSGPTGLLSAPAAGSTELVTLRSTSGSVSQGAGSVTAGALSAEGATGVDLSGPGNSVQQLLLLKADAGSTGGVKFTDGLGSTPLVVTTVDAAGGSATLANAGGLTLGGSVTAAAGTVTLAAANGAVMEQGAGAIAASDLRVSALSATLGGSNAVGAVDSVATSAGFTLVDAAPVLAVSGVTNGASGAVSLRNTAGDLRLAGAGVSISTAGSLGLDASGSLTQSGAITAGSLTAAAGAGVTLSALNSVPVLTLLQDRGGVAGASFATTTALTVQSALAGSAPLTLGAGAGPAGAAADLLLSGTGVTGGAVTLSASGAIRQDAGGVLSASTLQVQAGGAVTLTDAADVVTGAITGAAASATFGMQHALTLGAFTTTGALSLASGGAIAITGAVSTGGGLTVATSASATLGGSLSGAGGLTQAGTGVLTLSGSGNSFSGGLAIDAGAVVVGHGSNPGTGLVSLAAGTTLDVSAADTTLSGGLAVNGAADLVTSAGSASVGGALTGSGGLTLSGGSLTLANTAGYTGALTDALTGVLVFGANTGVNASVALTTGKALAVVGQSAGGAFNAVISGLAAGDTLDARGSVGAAATAAMSGTDLQLKSAAGVTLYTFHLAAAPSANTIFTVAADGYGGSVVTVGTNTAPTITGANGAQTTDDRTPVQPFSTVAVNDPDAGQTQTAVVSFAATNGALAGPGIGAGVVNGATVAYTVSGTAGSVTSALQAATFTPTPNQVAPGATVTTTFTITDTDGVVAAPVSNATSQVTVTSVNDAPMLSGTHASTVSDHATAGDALFSNVVVTDPDVGQTETATISFASANGKLSGATLVSTAADGTATYTVSADSATSLQGALQAVSFAPTPQPAGTMATQTAFTVSVSDGVASTTPDTGTVVTATHTTNTPVAAANGSAGQAIDDKHTAQPFAAVTVTDPDSGQTETATIAYAAANGVLGYTGTDATFSGAAGSYTVSAGSAAALQAALQAVVFTPTANQASPGATVQTAFSVSVSDGGVAAQVSDTVTTTSVDDAPTLAGTHASATSDRTADALFSGVTVSDPDQPAQAQTATIGFAAGAGVLKGAGAATTADGVTTYTLQAASASALSTALQAVTFTPTAAPVGPATATAFSLSVSDGQAASATDLATVVTVTHGTNTAPAVAGLPASVTAPSAASVVLAPGLTITDPDAGASVASAQVAIVSSGFTAGDLLTVTPAAGITAAYDTATGVLSLTGAASDAAYQQTLETVAFRHDGIVAAGTRTVSFTVTDDAGGVSQATSETVNVGAYSDLPPSSTPAPTPSQAAGYATQTDNLLRVAPTDPALSDPSSPIHAQAQAAVQIAAQLDAGRLGTADAQAQLFQLVDGTTSVAEIDYAFFTGKTPTAAGLNYLVHFDSNPTDLNDPYYAKFTTENRYINFAANLGRFGDASTSAFHAAYDGLSLSDATAKAYQAIFGTAATADKVNAILNTLVPDGLGGTETRAQYFAYYGTDGANGIGTKSAMIGWLLSDSVKEGFGTYQQADQHFLQDLAHGTAVFNVDLLAAYADAPTLVGQPVTDPSLGS